MKRPWYVVPTLLATWALGLRGVLGGISNIAFLRAPRLPDVEAAARSARELGDPKSFVELAQAVVLQGIHDLARVTFPLSIAQLLLAGLLLVASALAMGGRKGAHSLALQAIAANGALAIAAYALTSPVRDAWIDAVVQIASALPEARPERVTLGSRAALVWLNRLELVTVELGVLALTAFALTRARARSYFAAIAEANERAEDR